MQNLLRSSFIPALIVLCIAASCLFAIKYHVQILSKNLDSLIDSVVTAKKDIHILKAELTYLSKPDKVKKIIHDKLDLIVPQKAQIMSVKKFNEFAKQKSYELHYAKSAERRLAQINGDAK